MIGDRCDLDWTSFDTDTLRVGKLMLELVRRIP